MSEKPKASNPQKWRIWTLPMVFLALAGLVIIIVGITIAMALVGTYFSTSPNEELEGAEAREFIEGQFFTLPEDASEIYLYDFSMQDFEAYIRFSASPESLELWLNSNDLCFDDLSRTGKLYNTSGEVLSWWTPNASSFNADSEACESSLSYQISIDQSDFARWIAYIAIFGS